jgi:hypothetical protein
MKTINRSDIKKYLKLFFLILILILSIKPFLFTWNFVRAAFHAGKDPAAAGVHMYRALSYKPPVYDIFNHYHPWAVERYLVRSAVITGDKSKLDNPGPGVDRAKLLARFSGNFYVQDLLGALHEQKDLQNLDPVSLDFLADPRMNPVTRSIMEKIRPGLDRAFIKNLLDYVTWKENTTLASALRTAFNIKAAPFTGGRLAAAPGTWKTEILKKYGLGREEVGKNLLGCPGFSDPRCVEQHWYFSVMAGKTVFSRGSFVMGTDVAANGQRSNPVIRIMGFFVSRQPGKSRPRAGIRGRKKIPAENGYYVFSFDYCTATGDEAASFWLSRGVKEMRLPATGKKWRTVFFILNNSANAHELLNPLVRMWGTGTLLVDNMFLAKIIPPRFSLPGAYALDIENK